MEYLKEISNSLNKIAENINPDEHTINIVSLILTILGTVGTLIIGVITLSRIMKYIKDKQTDSLFGFYERLKWLLKLLDNALGVNETNELNALFIFSENVNIRKKYDLAKIKDFKYCIDNIIILFCQHDNQMPISNGIEEATLSLFNEILKYRSISINVNGEVVGERIFTPEKPEEDLNEEAKMFRGIVDKIINIIDVKQGPTRKRLAKKIDKNIEKQSK